jgi:predicted nucleotidyltransferase
VRDRHASWALSEIEFKCMLAEAHRMGLIALSTADLKDRNRLADVEASAVTYKNTVWHYVRVEE